MSRPVNCTRAALAGARAAALAFQGTIEAERAIEQWCARAASSARRHGLYRCTTVAVPAERHPRRSAFVAAKLASSNSKSRASWPEARVRIGGVRVGIASVCCGSEHLLQIGKRSFARVRLVAA